MLTSHFENFSQCGCEVFDSQAMFESDDPENKKWITRLGKLFDGVAVNNTDANDMRIDQLKNTFKSTANLVLTIESSDVDLGLIGNQTIEKAENILAETNKQG